MPRDDERMTPALMRTDEACDYLALSRTSLWRLEKSGELHPIRVGGAVRWRRSDLDALIERAAQAVEAHQ